MGDYAQRFRVISTRMVSGKPLVHVFDESNPGDGFLSAAADLEDVFFSKIAGLN